MGAHERDLELKNLRSGVEHVLRAAGLTEPSGEEWSSRVFNALSDLRREIDELAAERNDLLELLGDVTAQGCGDRDGGLDTMALSSYADAVRTLARYGKVEILSEHGRRVTARWVQDETPS